jgi:hypothetical protein
MRLASLLARRRPSAQLRAAFHRLLIKLLWQIVSGHISPPALKDFDKQASIYQRVAVPMSGSDMPHLFVLLSPFRIQPIGWVEWPWAAGCVSLPTWILDQVRGDERRQWASLQAKKNAQPTLRPLALM